MQSKSSAASHHDEGITKFTNCRILKGSQLVEEDVWISSDTGKILNGQEVFFSLRTSPNRVIDLGGRILSPGLIDVQLNGGFGFDFGVVPDDISEYSKGLQRMNQRLATTGVTSYLPTLPSESPEIYHKILHFLGPSGSSRQPFDGAESLGAHCEGPFLSPAKKGVHHLSNLRTAPNGFTDLASCYGESNLDPSSNPQVVKLITVAPEIPGVLSAIPEVVARGITVSLGHSEASYEQGSAALLAGARMITHLFNAMRPLHHRNPGFFGLLGLAPETVPQYSQPAYLPCSTPSTPQQSSHLKSAAQLDLRPRLAQLAAANTKQNISKPSFGLIADGIHLHPRTVALAAHAHPSGAILVSDAMALAGLPDGTYPWTNGAEIVKRGSKLTLVPPPPPPQSTTATAQSETVEGPLAGSAVTLLTCVNNFAHWSGLGLGAALRAVTEAPAELLPGLEGRKGTLLPGADADLVVLSEVEVEVDEGAVGGDGGQKNNRRRKRRTEASVYMVWKFGRCVFERNEKEAGEAE